MTLFFTPSVYVSFSLVLPLHSKCWKIFYFFLVNHTRILSNLCTHLPWICQAGESHPNYPNYWLLRLPGCDLHEVTFSSNMQTFATFFSGKQLTVLLSPLPLIFFFFCTTPLPLSLPLAIVFTQTEKKIQPEE